MRTVHALRGVAGVLTLLAASPSSAEPDPGAPRVDLRYTVGNGVAGCPTRERFLADITQQLAVAPPSNPPPPPPPTVAVTIAEGPRGLRASIAIDEGGAFSQQIDAGRDTCASLARAAAHAVALAVERLGEAYDMSTVDTPPPADPVVAPPVRRRRPRLPSPAPRAPPLEVDTHAGVAVSRGFVPAVGGAGLVGASLRKSWWILSLDVGAFGPARLVAEPNAEGATASIARISAHLVSLTPCAAAGRWFGCAAFDLVDLTASGLASPSRTARVPYFGARVGFELPLARPWTLEVSLGGQAPASRTEVRSSGSLLWRAPSLAADLTFRVRVQIL